MVGYYEINESIAVAPIHAFIIFSSCMFYTRVSFLPTNPTRSMASGANQELTH